MLGTMHFKIKTWRGLYKCRSQNERSWRFSYKMSLSTLEVTFVQAGFQFLSPLAWRKGGRLSERFKHPSSICFNVLTQGRVEDELITDSFSSAFSCMNRDNILVHQNAKRENLKARKWIEIRLIFCPPDEKGGQRSALYKTTNPCEIFWQKSSG